jgi:ABC-2 type transport system permease protein
MSESFITPTRTPWWRSFTILLRWQWAQTGTLLPIIVVLQVLMAAGIIIGFGLLQPEMPPASRLFLATGAPTVLLLTVGLVMVPQSVARARLDGSFTYLRSLPIARPLVFAADLAIWGLVSAPSIAVAVFVAWLRFDVPFTIDWSTLLATSVAIVLTATCVGYALAVTLRPAVAQLVSQALVFFVLLFSPITYPASNLPPWFAALHDVLPLRPAADLMRAGLAAGTYPVRLSDVVVLGVWCLAGAAVSAVALARRE